MAEHPHVDLMRKGYAAFASGDMEFVSSVFADDIVWHSPGDNPLAGDYQGKDAVFGLFARLMELTGGSIRQDIHDIVANDQHTAVLLNAHLERPDGRTWDGRQVHVWHVRDGKAHEFWVYNDDQPAADEFFA